MKVLLRNPRRELEVRGPMSVVKLLGRLDLNRESVLVISGGTLVPADAGLADEAEIEIRPVISGGQGRDPSVDSHTVRRSTIDRYQRDRAR